MRGLVVVLATSFVLAACSPSGSSDGGSRDGAAPADGARGADAAGDTADAAAARDVASAIDVAAPRDAIDATGAIEIPDARDAADAADAHDAADVADAATAHDAADATDATDAPSIGDAIDAPTTVDESAGAEDDTRPDTPADAAGPGSAPDAATGSPPCADPSPGGNFVVVFATPDGNTVEDIRAIRPDDVWLALDPRFLVSPPGGPIGVQEIPAQLWHWDGTQWSKVLGSDPAARYMRLWASGPDDVWVTGDRVRHWDGSTWTDRTPPGAGSSLLIHGVDPDDVWVTAGTVFHWDGTTWTERAPVAPRTGDTTYPMAIWAAGPGGAWLAGTAYIPGDGGSTFDQCFVERWDGTSWTVALASRDACFDAMWGSSPNDIWGAVGHIYHFDGRSWTDAVAANGIDQLWGWCATNVWATTSNDGSPSYHLDEKGWSPSAELSQGAVGRITGSSADDVWLALGYTVFHRALAP
jgi:hypothetical protein